MTKVNPGDTKPGAKQTWSWELQRNLDDEHVSGHVEVQCRGSKCVQSGPPWTVGS